MAGNSKRGRAPQGGPQASAWTQLSFEDQHPTNRLDAPPSSGEWLEVLVADLAIELGDVERIPSYREQVKELWRRSELSEADFARALLEVRARARSWRGKVNHARSDAEPGLKMKAFFLLLRDRVGLIGGTGESLSSVNQFKKV